ncbi:MAG: hypothetical protein ABIQ44_02965 [Chloroflexia bacterium]
MASRIGLIPEQTDLQLGSGESMGVVFSVTNAGPVVDAFSLAMQNVDPGWYTLSPAQISLFPGDEADVNLQIHPPAGVGALAGTYVFQLLATSIDSPTDFATSIITLTISAESELDLVLEPQKIVGRKGVFTLCLTNEGNVKREVVLHPTDAEERLAFVFGEAQSTPIPRGGRRTDPNAATQKIEVATGTAVGETIMSSRLATEVTPAGQDDPQGAIAFTIPPSSSVQIPITVAPLKRVWFGPVLNLRFEVAATPPGVEWEAYQARRVMGELVYNPVFSWWSKMPMVLRRLLAILFPLLLLALLLYMLFKPADKPPVADVPNVSATLTALAILNPDVGATLTALAANGPDAGATLTALAANAPDVAATLTAQAGEAPDVSATLTAQANNGQTTSGPLRILKFDWTTAENGSLAVTWEVTNALTVTLNSDIVGLTGVRTVDSTQDRSLTLSASNGKDTASRSLGVLLLKPPEIKVFKADPVQVKPGEGVVLSWEVLRADEILLDGNKVSGPNGSVSLQPQQSEQHTLYAKNNFGEVQMVVDINVVAQP